jgi:beta-apo-4'-carotenal oxygenase
MATSKIPPFQATPISAIPSTCVKVRAAYVSQRTKPLSYRLTQLRKLYWALIDNADLIVEACNLDLRKATHEVYAGEIDWCTNSIVFVTKNLAKWMKDESAPDIPLTNRLVRPKIRKDPMGAVLVIGCWNFPIQLSLGPFIGAIAAGCTAVLKPSEVSSHSAMVLKKLIEEALDPEAYVVINGGVEETTAVLNEKWDKIFYTGNAQVGTIIAKKAAETLTPVCLELGGRNPAIVTKNADPRLAARRLLWAKFLNAGQVCISQNYIMVDKEILPVFLGELRKALKEFFPDGTQQSPDFARIINKRHFHRIKKMLDETKGKIIMGGHTDESENFIEITVVQVDSPDDSLIKDESFGPLIPILPVSNLDEAIRVANSVHSTPLGLYPFGNKAETSRLLQEVASGGASVNDGYFHGCIATLPFGGVGDSGQGAYRGRASFETFTHRRSVTTTPGWMEGLLSVRYPPYAGKVCSPFLILIFSPGTLIQNPQLSKLRATSHLAPDFDRNGRTIHGFGYWLSFLVGLGGESVKGSLLRWIILAAVVFGSRNYGFWPADRSILPSYLR